MAHSNPEQNQADTRLDILWSSNQHRAMSTLRKNHERSERMEGHDMKFEEYYYYFQDDEHAILLMATVEDYIYFELWRYWNPPVIEVM